jgi:hypothetical protein
MGVVVGLGVGIEVGVAVGVGERVAVGVAVGVNVEGVGVRGPVGVGVLVKRIVGVGEGVKLPVGVGVPEGRLTVKGSLQAVEDAQGAIAAPGLGAVGATGFKVFNFQAVITAKSAKTIIPTIKPTVKTFSFFIFSLFLLYRQSLHPVGHHT